MYNIFFSFFTIIVIVTLFGCDDAVLPKPKGMLSLNYESASYEKVAADCDFSFSKNKSSFLKKAFKKQQCGYVLSYPKLNATIYLTHRKINDDLRDLLKDAQNLTQEHVVKADEIIPKSFEDPENKLYGMFYEVLGDAASQSQFYVTDSINNFLLGSLYFNVKPNYDSIYPAAVYLQKDMRHLMETTRWE